MATDHVDQILSQWLDARPDLDCSPMGISGRILRASRFMQSSMESVYSGFDLSAIEMDILATLRRSQKPLTPTQLYKTLMYSSGTMSTRIEGLVKRGMIYRESSGDDRRSCKVYLTEQGLALINELIDEHVANLHRLVSPLEQDEQEQLATLLKKLMVDVEKTKTS